MANQQWVNAANGHGPWQSGPYTAVTATSATDATLLGATSYNFPAGWFSQGDQIRVTANGIWTNGSTATTTTMTLFMGASLASSDTLLTLVSAVTMVASQTMPWSLEANITIRTVGAAATAKVWCQGKFIYGSSTTASTIVALPLTAAAQIGTNLSTQLAQEIGVSALVSQTTGAPSVTVEQYILEQVN